MKLRSYSLLAGSLLGVRFSANAQIIYTDVIPDDTIKASNVWGSMAQSFDLDLNNDGVTDFTLADGMQEFHYWGYAAVVFGGGSFVGIGNIYQTDPSYWSWQGGAPYKLSSNDSIGPSNDWVSPVGFASNWYVGIDGLSLSSLFGFNVWQGGEFQFGYWNNGVVDGFVGLRVNINGDYLYGWARLDVAADAGWMIIKDYAVNLTANSPILAGQCLCPPTGVEQSVNSKLTIYPNPVSEKLFLSGLDGQWNEADILIYDLSGRKILSQKFSSSQNAMDVSSLSNGIYFLELKNEDNVLVEKFELKH